VALLASLAAWVATVEAATVEVATVEVATVEEVAVQWAGTHGGALYNTISSCYLPKKIQHQ